jgi:thymidylate kinase/HD superfamily phosphodiesterase
LTSHSKFESFLWETLNSHELSPSHGADHVERVKAFALALQALHGGDPDVLVAAAILHDLGRRDPTLVGRASTARSVQLAREKLAAIGFPPEKAQSVCRAIEQHDQTNEPPDTIEAKILREADFLAGFGAWGILRTALWAGETGEGLEGAQRRLSTTMPARAASLEFSQTQKWAQREQSLTHLFLNILQEPPTLRLDALPGNYVVFEGTSGAGKGTQARRLLEHLKRQGCEIFAATTDAEDQPAARKAFCGFLRGSGKKAVLVSEPTSRLKETLRQWRKQVNEPMVEMFLFLADRYDIINTWVLPTLLTGGLLLSVRSFLSTLVYESTGAYDLSLADFLHRFVPRPDAILFFDVPPDIAYRRIVRRSEQTGLGISKFESPERLESDRARYKEILRAYPQTVQLDASRSESTVEQDIQGRLGEQGLI